MLIEKITEQQMNEKGVCAAPDILSGTPAENKAIFDRFTRQVVVSALNELIDQLESIGVERTVQLPSDAAGMKYIRLNVDNVLEVSDDGESWIATGAYYYVTNPAAGSVLYQTVQQLSDQQKSTARKNIGAVSSSEVDTAISEALGDYPAAMAALDTVIGGA